MSIATATTEIEASLLGKLRTLPLEQQQEALDFVEFLEQKTVAPKAPRRSLYGLCADLNVRITKEEIDEARREAWANFPREHFYTDEGQS